MKILLIQFYQIGDIVLSTPFPREIKRVYPEAKIDFLVAKGFEDVLKYNPNIENVITIDRKGGVKELLDVIKQVRNRKYDFLIDFHNNPRSAWISLFSGAKTKITYKYTKRKFAYNQLVMPKREYAIKMKSALLKPLGIECKNIRPEIFYKKEHLARINEMLINYGIQQYVTISPTHKRETRRWPLNYYIEVAKYIYQNYKLCSIFTAAPNEQEYLSPLKSENLYGKAFFIAPKMTLLELTALIDNALIHIGNDSAPHHIAVACKTPTFIILGSSSSGWVFPDEIHTYVNKKLTCQPCNSEKCKFETIPCLTELKFEDIRQEFDRFFKRYILKGIL
ncbi:glycosyltransferase family 9 protein [Deferribacter autotrophicus]|uniref:Glycosyltransferase family 9 protein n=1 Tax=Deferribacter autotrophicus TaxID=500465 RepID=A0A5A8F8T6_9BACT|nr:glycosyltransferase family 9 protein [Deferribacter autotrophicus]KAA0259002.1 glycosyltransferase family 9 protein [Deferribacter autotrophicus]